MKFESQNRIRPICKRTEIQGYRKRWTGFETAIP